MLKDMAVVEIVQAIKLIREGKEHNEPLLAMVVDSAVMNVMDYCHRNDFPQPLIMVLAETLANHLDTQEQAKELGNVKSMQMDETRIEYNQVSNTPLYFQLDSLYTVLNKYRKVWGSCK